MTRPVGAPIPAEAVPRYGSGRWGWPGGSHVPNPPPGSTTHLWDEWARTFGVTPQGPLPAMPTFVPDGAPFNGPRAIYADSLTSDPYEPLSSIVDKAAALATDPALMYTLVLSARTYLLRGFDHAGGYTACRIPPNLSIWGAGSGIGGGQATVFRLVEHTSAYNTDNCTWQPGSPYSPPKCRVLDVVDALPGWGFRHVRVEGGKQGVDNRGQGHPYNGLSVDDSHGAVVENVAFRGIRGYLPRPPGETGSFHCNNADGLILRNVEVDGRELGRDTDLVTDRVSSAGIMVNETRGAALIDIHVHHTQCGGGGIALWWSRDVATFNVWVHDAGGGTEPDGTVMGSKAINQERVHRCTHYSPRHRMGRLLPGGPPSLPASLNNDVGWNDTTGWTVNVESSITASKPETDWGSPAPVEVTSRSWDFTAPAGAATDGTRKRRSEVWLAAEGTEVRAVEGDLVDVTATFTPQLGPPGQATDGHWHCVLQLHGPPVDVTKQPWNPAAILVAAQKGKWWLHGGDGHPLHATQGGYVWDVPLGSMTDGVPATIRVETYLSADPDRGWVSCWFNGAQVLNRWKPIGGGLAGTGKRPGTLPDKAWVAVRPGLYRGTNVGVDMPSADQTIRVTIDNAKGVLPGEPGTSLIVDPVVDDTSDVTTSDGLQAPSVEIWSSYDPLGEGRTQLNTPDAGPSAVDRRGRPASLNMPTTSGEWVTRGGPSVAYPAADTYPQE